MIAMTLTDHVNEVFALMDFTKDPLDYCVSVYGSGQELESKGISYDELYHACKQKLNAQ